MHCEQIVREGFSEKYVSGELGEADREAYELHYFECERCSNELEALVLLRAELERSAPRAGYVAARARHQSRLWLTLAAAAVIALAVAVFQWQRAPEPEAIVSESTPAEAMPAAPEAASVDRIAVLARLAEVRAPMYRPPTLRSTPSPPVRRFREAMELYARGDYREAVPGLEEARALDATLPQVPFFLGACRLMTGEVDRAIDAWRAVIELGESAYLEESRFYLAKALLRKGDVAGARAELEATVALAGDREGEARDLLRQLQDVR
jgi:tetratricopeptide (TPR) repeat protein